MKLINKTQTTHKRQSLLPTVALMKGGAFRFNRLAVETFGLTPGTSVRFFQDEQRPKDWYVHFDEKEQPFSLTMRKSTSKDKECYVASRATATLIKQSIPGLDINKTYPIEIATEQTEGMFALLTSKLINA